MSTISDRFAAVADRLDLTTAIERLERNDLLPPRVEDKVPGQLRSGFISALQTALSDGTYRPLPADRIMVPKSRFSTRTAALMGLRDRVVFQALVDAAGAKIDRVLYDENRVIWPRGTPAPGRWKEFEQAPLADSPSHIVMADVAGFYESVEHDRLGALLVDATGSTPLAEACTAFLQAVMLSRRGLPQGHQSSDHLATLYLTEADAHIARAGLVHTRHGDDVRVPVDSYPDALRAAYVIEQGFRRCNLLMNGAKLIVETAESYEKALSLTDRDSERLRQELMSDAAERILEEGLEEDVFELLERIGIDIEAAGGYREALAAGLEDVEEIQQFLSPSTAEHAWATFADAMARRPGGKGSAAELSNAHFHERVAGSLPLLAGARDDKAISHCQTLLQRHPDESAHVTTYLSALSAKDPDAVADICVAVLESTTFMLGWQRALLWNTFSLAQVSADGGGDDRGVAHAVRVAESDAYEWIERLEALKFLASRDRLEQQMVMVLWERAPNVYRADIIAATARAQDQTWAQRFLATANQDPIHAVISRNVLEATSARRSKESVTAVQRQAASSDETAADDVI